MVEEVTDSARKELDLKDSTEMADFAISCGDKQRTENNEEGS